MVESNIIQINTEEVIDEKLEDKNMMGTDIFTSLEIELSNDVLLKKLIELNSLEEIVTDSMRDLLKEGTLYSTTAASKMLSMANSTLRGWINELDDYINPIYVGDTHKLTPKSIYKLRMVQLLRQDLNYGIGYIKSITLGTEVISEEKTKEKSLNEKVEELIQENENMKAIIQKMAQGLDTTQNVVMELIDNDTFSNTGQVLLKRDSIPQMLEANNDNTFIDKQINKSISKAKIELDETVNIKINEALKELNNKISEGLLEKQSEENKNIVISTDEIKSYSRKLKQKTVWQRLFGIKSKK